MADPSIGEASEEATEEATTIAKASPSTGNDPRPVELGGDDFDVVAFDARYPIERELGRGGMGTVNLCHDKQIGRHVAMKFVNSKHRDSAPVQARFVTEARVQAQLEHPAVVPVYELGRDPQGQVYFTMKRVRGISLLELFDELREGSSVTPEQYTRRRLLSELSRVCLAMDYAHRTGVVHRDLKPANIMLGAYGEVHVLDWGIAKATGDNDPRTETQGGRVLGTPGYMAPEQILSSSDVTGSADVYALGCVLFELLTLRRLHADTSVEGRIESTLRRDIPAPSDVAPDLEIAPELDVICLRATARDPDARYRSARDFHQALESFLDGQRDLALRREMAAAHTASARDAVEQLQADPFSPEAPATRREALRELGQALALEPTNDVAMETMVKLLTTPPKKAPREVAERLEIRQSERYRSGGRIAGVMYFSTLIYFPFMWLCGILDPFPIAAFFVCVGIAGSASLYAASSQRPRASVVLVAMAASTLAMGSTAGLFGPLVLTPGLLAVNASAYAVTLTTTARRIALAAALVVLAIPVGGEFLGIFASSYVPSADGLMILPAALRLDGEAAMILLAIVGIGTVATSIVSVGRLRDALVHAEQQLELYNWHFRQLMPDPRPPSDV